MFIASSSWPQCTLVALGLVSFAGTAAAGTGARSVALLRAPACPSSAALTEALAALGIAVAAPRRGVARLRVRVRRGDRYVLTVGGSSRARRITASGPCEQRATILALAIEGLLRPFGPAKGRRRPRAARRRDRSPERPISADLAPTPPIDAPPLALGAIEPAPVDEGVPLLSPDGSPLPPLPSPPPRSTPPPAPIPAPPPALARSRARPSAAPWSLGVGAVGQSGDSGGMTPGLELEARRAFGARLSLAARWSWRPQSASGAGWSLRVDDLRLGAVLGVALGGGLRIDAALSARARLVSPGAGLTGSGATSLSAVGGASLVYGLRFGPWGLEAAAGALVFFRAEAILVDGEERLAGDRAALELALRVTRTF